VRTEHVEKLLHLLSYCGFTPNSKKTFYNGSFRESCGADWFAGEDVRPYTLDHKLDSVQNIFKFLNLSRRSFRTELFFREVRSSVLHVLPRNLRLFRPQRGPADSGIDTTGDEHLYAPHCRFNKNLQCWEYLELITTPRIDKYWCIDSQRRNAAVVYAMLSGSHSSNMFTMRRSSRTKVRFISYSGATSLWLPATA